MKFYIQAHPTKTKTFKPKKNGVWLRLSLNKQETAGAPKITIRLLFDYYNIAANHCLITANYCEIHARLMWDIVRL